MGSYNPTSIIIGGSIVYRYNLQKRVNTSIRSELVSSMMFFLSEIIAVTIPEMCVFSHLFTRSGEKNNHCIYVNV